MMQFPNLPTVRLVSALKILMIAKAINQPTRKRFTSFIALIMKNFIQKFMRNIKTEMV